MRRLTLPVCLLLVLAAGVPSDASAPDAQPKLGKGEKVVLALLGMVGSEEPAKVARGKRLMALQADADKLRPLSLALTCNPKSLRIFAARELSKLSDKRAQQPLLVRVLREPEPTVRKALAAALRDRASPDTVHVLGKALWSRYAPTRRHAAEALGRLGDALGAAYVIRRWEGRSGDFPRVYITQVEQTSYIQDFDVEVASTSFIADPIVGTAQNGFSHAVKIIGTEQIRSSVEAASYRGALTSLAGRNHGRSVGAWKRWWTQNEAALLKAREAHYSPSE